MWTFIGAVVLVLLLIGLTQSEARGILGGLLKVVAWCAIMLGFVAITTIIAANLFPARAEEPNAYEQCMRDAQERAANPWQLKNLEGLCVTDHFEALRKSLLKEMECDAKFPTSLKDGKVINAEAWLKCKESRP